MAQNKILLILQREYLVRVRKKSFIIMTILGPFLFAALFILPSYLLSLSNDELKTLAVIDSTGVFTGIIPETRTLRVRYLRNTSVEEVRAGFDTSGYYALLYIAPSIHNVPSAIQLMSYKQPNLAVSMHIANAIEKEIEKQKLKTYNIDNLDHILQSVKTQVQVRSIKWTRDGKEKSGHAGVAMGVAYLCGLLTYIFILLYCTQIMRGVIEEKSSRIIEVIVSSVKPFQLMAGKIIGIALAGLTQFALWIMLTIVVLMVYKHFAMPSVTEVLQQQPAQNLFSNSTLQPQQMITSSDFQDIFSAVVAIDFLVIGCSFLFYFLFGYLVYGSLFAAVGSMADTETDTQQFMMPVTIPLGIALLVMLSTIYNPDSGLSFWFSIIPLTSPVVMMARIPYGVPYWQVTLSAVLLIASFFFFTWLSARIYKTGILMYGKKAGIREFFRWIKS